MSDKLDWDNLQSEQGYGREGHEAYGTSKLATNMWSYLLADKLAAAGSSVSVTCVDPGTVATKILFQGGCGASGGVGPRRAGGGAARGYYTALRLRRAGVQRGCWAGQRCMVLGADGQCPPRQRQLTWGTALAA